MNIWTLWGMFMGLATGIWVGSILEILRGQLVSWAAWGAYLVGVAFCIVGVQ